MTSLLPGPPELQNLLWAHQIFKDPRNLLVDNTRRYGPIWQSRIAVERGSVPLIWLMGPAGNERVLSPKHKDDFSFREGYTFGIESLVGRDVLCMLDDEPEGEGAAASHRDRLRLLAPAMHPRLDGEYATQMAAIISRHLSRLPIGQPVDLGAEIRSIAFHILAALLLGAAESELPQLGNLFELLGRGRQARLRLGIPGTRYYRARRAHGELAAFLQAKLDRFRRGEAAPPPMLAPLLHEQEAARELFPDEILIAELLALLLLGYDPTASLLVSTIAALGDSPEVFRRLRDELRVAIADRLSPDDPLDLPYLDAVLLETERLFPPLPFAVRGVRRDFEFGGFTIEKGSKVAYSAYYTGRCPEVFDDPLTFAPERFLHRKGNSVIRPQPYTLLGFGGGHRMCIGKRLASTQARLFMSTLLQRFDVECLDQESDAVFFNPTLQRKHGYWVRLHRRYVSLPTVTEL
jgi:cytochrome P450